MLVHPINQGNRQSRQENYINWIAFHLKKMPANMTGCRDGVADAESIVRGALSIPRSGLNGTAVAVAVGLVLTSQN